MENTLTIRLIIVVSILGLTACAETNEERRDTIQGNFEYGVFLSLSGREAVEASEGYEMVVIDAQNLSKEDITEMKARGQEVYSYLNVGSLENFRTYYNKFQHLALKPYENWENEYWIDVTNEAWQEFTAVTLANEVLEKGIDGFWIDNVDVYGQFPTEETYSGVEEMLKTLMSHGKPVIINGGDEFVQTYMDKNQQVDDILTGVNQETVFSSIHFEENTFGTQSEDEQDYYLNYLNDLEEAGKDIFLLEYTTNSALIQDIQDYVTERRWKYYISNSIELDR